MRTVDWSKPELAKFTDLSVPVDMTVQCAKTAFEHGFHGVHLDLASKALGYQSYNALKEEAEKTGFADTVRWALDALATAGIVGDPFVFLALIGGEAAEAMEAARKGNWTKDDGVLEELADVVIRILDFVGRFKPVADPDGKERSEPAKTEPEWQQGAKRFWDIVREKMAYNELRPYLHGKKF